MKYQIWPIIILSSLVFIVSFFALRTFFQSRARKTHLMYLNSLTPKRDELPLTGLRQNGIRFRLIQKFNSSIYGVWFKDVAIRSGLWEETDFLTLVGRKGEISIGVFIVFCLISRLNKVSDIFIAFGLAFLAFFIPDLWIYNRLVNRAKAIEAAIPETIELLNMCVRAGLGFQAGMMRIAQTRSNPLSEEFNRVLSEIRLGESRADAFLALSDRLQIESLRGFVNSILQVDKLGIPIAKVLEDLAVTMRNIQRDKAREKAQKVSVKILAPIMICLLPALLMIVLGPTVITVVKLFA